MYPGYNDVILHYSEWIIQIGIHILFFCLIILCTKLYIYSPSKAPQYLIYQSQINWESRYLTNITLIPINENCVQGYNVIQLGFWSGIDSDSSCICYSEDNVYFTTSNKKICKHNKSNKKYKNIYICKKIPAIDKKTLTSYNGYKFCGQYSNRNISSYHDEIITYINRGENAIDLYKTHEFSLNSPGIIDIKLSKNNMSHIFTEYEERFDNGSDKFYLYIKYSSSSNRVNIYEFNEFITSLHYSNELICTYDDMSNNIQINIFYKNSRNVFYSNNKKCLLTKNKEYKNYYIDDNFIRTSIVDVDIGSNINNKDKIYKDYPEIQNYYNISISDNKYINILNSGNKYPLLVAQKYLYGVGCQYYKKLKSYNSLLDYFYHNKNIALTIIIFTLASSVISIIFISFNMYRGCVDYPIVYLTFSIILVTCMLVDMIMSGIYLGFCIYLRKNMEKILSECRIDFSGKYSGSNYYMINYNNNNKSLPIEVGLYEDLKYVLIIIIIMAVFEVVIFIMIIIYFCCNCYKYTFITLENVSLKDRNILEKRI